MAHLLIPSLIKEILDPVSIINLHNFFSIWPIITKSFKPLEAISRKLSGDMMEEEEEEEQIKQEEPTQHVITENESGTQSHNACLLYTSRCV